MQQPHSSKPISHRRRPPPSSFPPSQQTNTCISPRNKHSVVQGNFHPFFLLVCLSYSPLDSKQNCSCVLASKAGLFTKRESRKRNPVQSSSLARQIAETFVSCINTRKRRFSMMFLPFWIGTVAKPLRVLNNENPRRLHVSTQFSSCAQKKLRHQNPTQTRVVNHSITPKILNPGVCSGCIHVSRKEVKGIRMRLYFQIFSSMYICTKHTIEETSNQWTRVFLISWSMT